MEMETCIYMVRCTDQIDDVMCKKMVMISYPANCSLSLSSSFLHACMPVENHVYSFLLVPGIVPDLEKVVPPSMAITVQ